MDTANPQELCRYKAVFQAQAWKNDNAIDVDPAGETEFDVTPEILRLLKAGQSIPESNRDESDELRSAGAAPGWIRDWQGPFYITVVATARCADLQGSSSG